ncbi:MAG: nitroreductase family protein [Actinomycetota bacterium]|nr:nitroreductase family protein [Actinomycetota bacterium]
MMADFDDIMRTTFACREFTEDPVNDATIHRILDTARFAPSGGNRQGNRVIVLRDKEVRRQLVPMVREASAIYVEQTMAGESPWQSVKPTSIDEGAVRANPAEDAMRASTTLVTSPVLLVITLDLGRTASFDKDLDRVGVISGASIYPFVWGILLAARNEGLGGVLTTYAADKESEVQRLLNIPDHHAVAALVPLGHPVKQLTKLNRTPVEKIATIGTFDGDPFTI